MIERREVVVFIDDMIIVTETKKGHSEIVKEVLRRIEENNLFVKLEKYMWKVREVGFLEVIIEPDRIKMEKKKIQEMVNWLVPKSVKNM